MMVMMMAITPSLKASRRPLPMTDILQEPRRGIHSRTWQHALALPRARGEGLRRPSAGFRREPIAFFPCDRGPAIRPRFYRFFLLRLLTSHILPLHEKEEGPCDRIAIGLCVFAVSPRSGISPAFAGTSWAASSTLACRPAQARRSRGP